MLPEIIPIKPNSLTFFFELDNNDPPKNQANPIENIGKKKPNNKKLQNKQKSLERKITQLEEKQADLEFQMYQSNEQDKIKEFQKQLKKLKQEIDASFETLMSISD